MSEDIDDNIEEYKIITKTSKDILSELNLKDDDNFICESIITNLEKTVAKNVREGKCAQIPLIGCIRKNPVKVAIRKDKLNLSAIRKQMSKEEYKEYVKNKVIDYKNKQKEKEHKIIYLKKIINKNKDKYEKLYKKLGKAYADMFIYSIYFLKEVPFDKEWEYNYQQLIKQNNNE